MFRGISFIVLTLTLIVVGSGTSLLGTDEQELAEAEHVLARVSDFYLQRAYPFSQVPAGARRRALEQLRRDHTLLELNTAAIREWQPLGPSLVPNGQPLHTADSPPISVSGRATAVIVDPRNPDRLFIGAAQGGVWRSTDAGGNWQPVTDMLPSLAVGALAMDARDPNIIYLGTGEAHFSQDSYYGAGVFKSTDGGTSWAAAGKLPERARIARICIDPADSQTLYVATTSAASGELADTGIFKSVDGGASWRKSLDGIATDISIDPQSPANIIAALGNVRGSSGNGVYRSTDAGATWQLVNALPSGSSTGRIELARAPSAPNLMLASVARAGTAGLMNLFSSADGGASWKIVSAAPDYCGGQCFYNNFVAFHPLDASIIFLGGVPVFRSTDSGNSFVDISSARTFGPGLHADNHAIAFHPTDRNTFYVANDGGIFRTADLGDNWTPLNNGLATLQFQSVATHPSDGRRAVGGTQDNGTLLYSGSSIWSNIDFGDGGDTAIDPNAPNTIYHFYFFLFFARSDDGGQTFAIKTLGLPTITDLPNERALFYAPLAMDAINTSTLYTGASRLYRTTNRGDSWSPISPDLTKGSGAVSAIAIAPDGRDLIYAGTSDGNVARMLGRGASWEFINAGLPNRFITRITIDPKESQVAYITYSGFGSGHIFKTRDGGESWHDVSGNLPDIPVNAIAIDSERTATIYLGTDIGVFVSESGGKEWRALNVGLPAVAVFDLDLNRQTGQLIAATHGRGMYALALDGSDDGVAPQVVIESPNGGESFTAGDTVTIRWNARDDRMLATQDILLSLDGGNSFDITVASGLAAAAQSFNWIVPQSPTLSARIRVVARDLSGNVGAASSAADFSISAALPAVITKVRQAGNKLIVDGVNFMANDTVIEIDGRQLAQTKYPSKFIASNGTTTRLQGIDSRPLTPGRSVAVTVLTKSTGRRSPPFTFTP